MTLSQKVLLLLQKKSVFKFHLSFVLEGTNVDKGKALLNESGLNIIAADTMADGAQKIVELVG